MSGMMTPNSCDSSFLTHSHLCNHMLIYSLTLRYVEWMTGNHFLAWLFCVISKRSIYLSIGLGSNNRNKPLSSLTANKADFFSGGIYESSLGCSGSIFFLLLFFPKVWFTWFLPIISLCPTLLPSCLLQDFPSHSTAFKSSLWSPLPLNTAGQAVLHENQS